MEPEEIKKILASHNEWVESRRSKGEQAIFHGSDLRKADLSGAMLQCVDMSEANLEDAKLLEADLKVAILESAKLWNVDMRKADLKKANLKGAFLQGANMEGADLRDADLREANLFNANLQKADLTGTDFFRANFEGTNLRGAKVDRSFFSIYPNIQRVRIGKNQFIIGVLKKKPKNIIEFPPEYAKAGISILNYFAVHLRKKYSQTPARIQIKHEGTKLVLVVDPIEGNREVIKLELNKG